MNTQQTRAEANRQIRLLMQDCTPEERKKLEKYIKAIVPPARHKESEIERLGDILPLVMENIRRRMEHQKAGV